MFNNIDNNPYEVALAEVLGVPKYYQIWIQVIFFFTLQSNILVPQFSLCLALCCAFLGRPTSSRTQYRSAFK
jgi:hypothetical protein